MLVKGVYSCLCLFTPKPGKGDLQEYWLEGLEEIDTDTLGQTHYKKEQLHTKIPYKHI